MEPLWDSRKQISSNGLGHITKVSAMSIYGKTFKISVCLEQNARYFWNLVYSIGHLSTTKFIQIMILDWPLFLRKFVQTMTLGWHLTFSYKGQLWFLILLYGPMLEWMITRKLLKSMILKLRMISTWRYMCTRGTGHFWPLSKVTQNETVCQVSDTGP